MPETNDAHPGTKLSSAPASPTQVEALEPRLLFTAVPLINEFLAVNDSGLVDEDGDHSDWLELHNAGDTALDLNGWFLTDDASDLERWALPSVSLAAGEYLVIFASGEDRAVAGSELHTNFKLGSSGEYLALVEPDGNTIAHAYAPAFPAQSIDVSFGLAFDNPSDPGFFATPTPGQTNGAASVQETVTFSHTANVFASSFQLVLSGASAGQTIHYTLDGAVPDSGSAAYTGPITVNATTQVRAIVAEPGMADGRVRTMSYSRLGADVLAFASQLPILLIENFGGGEIPGKGWNQTGGGIVQVPRQASAVTVFGNGSGNATFTGAVDLHSMSGIRERGAFSTTFPKPGYSLETWGEDGDDQDVSVFGMASESDWILYAPNSSDQTLMNNQFMFELANQMGLWAPQVQFVEAFINTDGGDVTMADYVGLYVWTEKVKRTEGRLDFEAFNDDGTAGGFLLSINRQDAIPEGLPSNTTQPSFHTAGPDGVLQTSPNSEGIADDIPRQYNAYLNYEHPNGYAITPTQRNAIGAWFQEMEDVLYGRTATAWNDPVDGYANYIDVENFIDYYILHNLSKNQDGLLLSMWIYNPDPNNGGRLMMGPPWDHDLGSFEASAESDLLHRADRLWYARLFQDPAFVQQYQDRWQMWRQSVLTESNMFAIFDNYTAEIGEDAILRDGTFADHANELDQVKIWLSARVAALDAQFDTPPVFSQHGGEVDSGYTLSMTAPAGAIYYTTNNADPRLADGSIHPDALFYDGTAITTQLITTGSAWRYLDDGSDQGTAWRTAGFDDTAWDTGDAQLGYGDGDEVTTLSFGPDSENKFITTYFRSTFTVADPAAFTTITLNLLRDDGASVYINGKEVVRSNMPGTLGDNTITSATLAASSVSGNAETTLFYDYIIDTRDLVAGLNTIAVEIHQNVGNSSDISFDLELLGQTATDPPIPLSASQTITARSRLGTSWSGLARADFFVGTRQADATNTRITELHYNPLGPTASEQLAGYTDGDQFEFLEVLNTSANTIDFKGVSFGAGLTMSIADFAELAPGQRGVFVSDPAAFQERYGTGITILGTYTGNLANGGEPLALNDNKTNSVIQTFRYEDGSGVGEEDWPTTPDGDGPSLVVIDTEADYNDGNNWQASTTQHGTPGSEELAGIPGDITGDGYVGAGDLDALLATWGDAAASSPQAAAADLNHDGTVNTPDLTLVINNFGNGTPPPTPTSNPGSEEPGSGNPSDNNPDNNQPSNPAAPNNNNNNNNNNTRPNNTAPPAAPPVTPPATPTRPSHNTRPAAPLTPTQQRAVTTRNTTNLLAMTRPNTLSSFQKPVPNSTTPARDGARPSPRFDALAIRNAH